METLNQIGDEPVACASVSYEVSLKNAFEEAMGILPSIDEMNDVGLKDGVPAVTFCISNLDRDVTDSGIGEVFFIENRACNDQGWCQGDSVLLPTEFGFAVLDAPYDCPE